MPKSKKISNAGKSKKANPLAGGAANGAKRLALHYMETLAEIARESFLLLDPNLRVVSANETFYKNFQVLPKETEDKFVYDLGNGQWNIPELRGLLEKVLPEKKIVKDYEVEHDFETIGGKIMLLNAKQLDAEHLIILAIEDVTVRRELEKSLAEYTKGLEVKVVERTKELEGLVNELETVNKTMVGRELKMVELKEEIEGLKKRVSNGNGKNGNGKNGKNGKNGNGNHESH